MNKELPHYAYCTHHGFIDLGTSVPDGRIALCVGSKEFVSRVICNTAMFGENQSGEIKAVVPGTHCKYQHRANLSAIAVYLKQLQKHDQPNFRALGA
jgi:hypothetical protein